jgi:hypothetical protein
MRIGSGSLKTFTIKGTQLHKPKSVYPVNKTLNSRDNPQIRFSWTDLDQRANTYKVYLYVGSPINGIEGQVVLWQKEVMASDYEDTMSVEIDAASVMTTNKYTWRVIAIDDRGAGTAGDIVEFNYNVPSGVFRIKTMEQVSVNDTVSSSPVGLVELKAEVLDGSMEAGMLYTDFNGNLVRERPAGTYRLTAIKSEFMPQTQTVVLSENDTTEVTFYLERPQSTIFGGVYDVSGNRINLARVYAVSDLGDSSSALTDASGNFVLRAYGQTGISERKKPVTNHHFPVKSLLLMVKAIISVLLFWNEIHLQYRVWWRMLRSSIAGVRLPFPVWREGR